MSDNVDSGSSKGGKRRRRPALIVAAVVVALIAVAALLGLASSSNAGEVPRGVEVRGIAIGGMSAEEAERLLRERAYALDEVRVSGDGESVTIPAESLGVRPDVESTVENAMEVGREGNIAERLGERADGLFGTVEVPLAVSYDESSVRSEVEGLARRLNAEPRQAEVSVSADGVEVAPSAEGYRVDESQTAANIRGAIESLEGEARLAGGVSEPEITTAEAQSAAETARTVIAEPALLTAGGEEWRLTGAELASAVNVVPREGEPAVELDRESLRAGLEDMYSSVNAPAREADFRFAGDSVEVVPGQIGERIESQKLLSSLQSGLTEGQRQYQVPVVEDRPELTTREAERLKPTQKIGDYRTRYEGVGDQARVENLRMSGEALTGQTVAPGEVFSVNDVLAGLDYNETKVFLDGESVDALGGGLCQVASTLYMAVNFAGLDPVERHPHYAVLDYIRPGLDATIWFGAENGYSGQELDFEFRNNSDGYVMIREYVADDGYIYSEVWGQPTGREVSMNSELTESSPDSATWTTYKTIEGADGGTVFDGVLHTDTYNSIETEDGTVAPSEVEPAPVDP